MSSGFLSSICTGSRLKLSKLPEFPWKRTVCFQNKLLEEKGPYCGFTTPLPVPRSAISKFMNVVFGLPLESRELRSAVSYQFYTLFEAVIVT